MLAQEVRSNGAKLDCHPHKARWRAPVEGGLITYRRLVGQCALMNPNVEAHRAAWHANELSSFVKYPVSTVNSYTSRGGECRNKSTSGKEPSM